MPTSSTHREAGDGRTPTDQPSAAAASPTPAAQRRQNMHRFWRHHPVVFVALLVLVGFTEFEMHNHDGSSGHGTGPGWFVALCGVLCIALGVYEMSTPGANTIAKAMRDPGPVYGWMPKSTLGVRIIGVFMALIGVLATGGAIAGV